MKTTYLIESETGFFDDLNVMLVALSSVTIAAELHNGRIPRYSAGDYITIECKHLPLEVRLPLVGPIAVALAEKKPDRIELTVVDRDPALGNEVGGTSGLSAVIDAVFQPFFTNFYERHIEQIRDKFGNTDTSWPTSWQMGWVVRNAVAHNGCVYFRSHAHPSVEWRALSISPADNDTEVLGGFLNWADLLMLAFDMEEDLTGAELPRVKQIDVPDI